MRLVFALLTLFSVATAEAETVGVSYFAGEAFTKSQTRAALRVFDGVTTQFTAILFRTFGVDGGFSRAFCRKYRARPHILQVHFSNEANRRRGVLQRYEFLPGLSVRALNQKLANRDAALLQKYRTEARALTEWLASVTNSKTIVIVSTGLEDNFTTAAYRVVLDLLREELPSDVLIARAPVSQDFADNDFNGADFVELHGATPNFRGYAGDSIVNFDGQDIDFRDGRALERALRASDVPSTVKRIKRGGHLLLLWWGSAQGIERGRFIAPRSRRFVLDREVLSQVNLILRSHQ